MIEELKTIERACIVVSKVFPPLDLKFKVWEKDNVIYGGIFAYNKPMFIKGSERKTGGGELELYESIIRDFVKLVFIADQKLTEEEKQSKWWNKVDTGYESRD